MICSEWRRDVNASCLNVVLFCELETSIESRQCHKSDPRGLPRSHTLYLFSSSTVQSSPVEDDY